MTLQISSYTQSIIVFFLQCRYHKRATALNSNTLGILNTVPSNICSSSVHNYRGRAPQRQLVGRRSRARPYVKTKLKTVVARVVDEKRLESRRPSTHSAHAEVRRNPSVLPIYSHQRASRAVAQDCSPQQYRPGHKTEYCTA